MLPGYHLFFRQIAGKVFRKEADIPKDNLAVEEKGEEMGRLPLSYKFHTASKEKFPLVEDRSYSDIQDDKTSPIINAADFPRMGYIGEGVYYE